MAEAEGDEEEAEARRRGVSERLVAQRRAERGDASTSAVADDSSTEAEAIRSKMQGKNEKNSTQKANFLGLVSRKFPFSFDGAFSPILDQRMVRAERRESPDEARRRSCCERPGAERRAERAAAMPSAEGGDERSGARTIQ